MNLSIFKTRSFDKKRGFAFEGFTHDDGREFMSARLFFKDKKEAREYAERLALKCWNF